MIYELRIYTAHPGKMRPLVSRFRDHTYEMFEKHGIKNVGYWLNTVGRRWSPSRRRMDRSSTTSRTGS